MFKSPFFIDTSNVSELTKEEYKLSEQCIASKFGARAGFSPFAYIIFLIIFNAATETGSLFLQTFWLIELLLLVLSVWRYQIAKKLGKAVEYNFQPLLKLYYILSLVSGFLWGTVVGIMIWLDQMHNFSYLILATTIAIIGASFGTMASYFKVWIQFVLCMLVPIFLSVTIMVILGVEHSLLVLFLLTMNGFLVFQARWISLDYQTGILRQVQLESQSNKLADALQTIEKQQVFVEQHRDHLQELVDEQTADLIFAKEKAEQADRAKSEFLANMTHELKTPLHMVLSFAQCAKRQLGKSDNDKIANFLEKVDKSGNKLLNLVNELLDLASLEANLEERQYERVNITETVSSVSDELSELFEEKQLQLMLETPEEAINTSGDKNRIAQVLRNLLTNAVKFSPENSQIILRCYTDNDQIRLEVQDQGPGVPDSEKELIFDKFNQSTRTRTGAGGTGLGLAICAQIIKMHNGKIWVEDNIGSDEHSGALFVAVFPAYSED